jgi:hypothetical protein
LPTGPIKSGDSTATLPPLTFHIDGTAKNAVTIKALTFTAAFNLPSNITSVTIDGTELLGKETSVNLFEKKSINLISFVADLLY